MSISKWGSRVSLCMRRQSLPLVVCQIRALATGKRLQPIKRDRRISEVLQLGTFRSSSHKLSWKDAPAHRAPVIRPSLVDPSIPEDPIVERWRQQVASAKMASIVWEVYHEVRMDAFRGDTELFNLIIGRAGHTQPEGIYKMVVTMLSRNLMPNEGTIRSAFRILRNAERFEDIIALHKLITHARIPHISSSLLYTVVAIVEQSGPDAAEQFIYDRLNTWPDGSKDFIHIDAILYAIKAFDSKNPVLRTKRFALAEKALRHFVNRLPDHPFEQNTDKLSQEVILHRPDIVYAFWELYPGEKRLINSKTLGKLSLYAIDVKQDIRAARKMFDQGLSFGLPTADILCVGLLVLSRSNDTDAFETFWKQYPYFEGRVFDNRVYALALEHYALNVSDVSLEKALAMDQAIPAHRRADETKKAMASVYIAHGKIDDAMNIIHKELREPLDPRQWCQWIHLTIRHKNHVAALKLLDSAFGVLRFSSKLHTALLDAFGASSSADAIKRAIEAQQLLSEDVAVPFVPIDDLSLNGLPVTWRPSLDKNLK